MLNVTVLTLLLAVADEMNELGLWTDHSLKLGGGN
jgi:hypothetical protein